MICSFERARRVPLICEDCDCNSLPREHSQREDYKWQHEASPIIAAGPEERWRVELAARQVGEDKDGGVGGSGEGGAVQGNFTHLNFQVSAVCSPN